MEGFLGAKYVCEHNKAVPLIFLTNYSGEALKTPRCKENMPGYFNAPQASHLAHVAPACLSSPLYKPPWTTHFPFALEESTVTRWPNESTWRLPVQ